MKADDVFETRLRRDRGIKESLPRCEWGINEGRLWREVRGGRDGG